MTTTPSWRPQAPSGFATSLGPGTTPACGWRCRRSGAGRGTHTVTHAQASVSRMRGGGEGMGAWPPPGGWGWPLGPRYPVPTVAGCSPSTTVCWVVTVLWWPRTHAAGLTAPACSGPPLPPARELAPMTMAERRASHLDDEHLQRHVDDGREADLGARDLGPVHVDLDHGDLEEQEQPWSLVGSARRRGRVAGQAVLQYMLQRTRTQRTVLCCGR